jgi:hypothetical protein
MCKNSKCLDRCDFSLYMSLVLRSIAHTPSVGRTVQWRITSLSFIPTGHVRFYRFLTLVKVMSSLAEEFQNDLVSGKPLFSVRIDERN